MRVIKGITVVVIVLATTTWVRRAEAQSEYDQYDAHASCDSKTLPQSGFDIVGRVAGSDTECWWRRGLPRHLTVPDGETTLGLAVTLGARATSPSRPGYAAGTGLAQPPVRWVDAARSTVTVRLSASGPDATTVREVVLLVPLAEGSVEETDPPHLAVVMNLAELQVVTPARSAEERARVRAQLLGPDGLDAERFSRITYHSLTVDEHADRPWLIRGELELRGRFLPLDIQTVREGDRFTGTATVTTSDFGLSPLRLAGSADPVGWLAQVDFDVVLEPRRGSAEAVPNPLDLGPR